MLHTYPVEFQFAQVAADIVTRYDIDGFHIDDYFYPASLPEEIDAEEFEKEKEKLIIS